MAYTAHSGRVLFDGHAGVIRHFLTQAGQTIKQGRFARVWRTDQGDGTELARDSRAGGLDSDAASWAAMAHPAAFRTATQTLWTEMDLAVSLRNATSTPSTQYTVGSPAGARRNASTRLSGTKPRCISWPCISSERSREPKVAQ